SSTMAEYIDEWASAGRKNIFGDIVEVSEMQSEGGASGAMHGALQGGALTSTFTASQGLLLMIPNMYKMAGELLPGVFHVSARSLAAQALSIFGDHSDVMSARQTGFAFLATSGIQEIMDVAAVAHLASIKTKIPFVHFFDGFRTSHEIQKVEYFENEDIASLVDRDALQRFRDNALNPEHPVTRGTAQNPDIYFQTREVANKFYDVIPDVVEGYMNDVSKLCGREYHPFNYYGHEEAENVIIAMGSVTETIKEVVDYKVKAGEKVGVIIVHLYRPFSEKYFFKAMPDTVKRISVLDRTKEIGAPGEPLYLDVRGIYFDKQNAPMVIGGRYGLSSKDTTPAQIVAVFTNLAQKEPKNGFSVGIVDDVTYKSLPVGEEISVVTEGTFEGKFWGLGSDGTVGANKNSIKIIGGSTDKYAQAYFSYDSKKSGGVTISHLRFGDLPISSPYLVNTPDFVACHVPAYLGQYDMLKGLKKGGGFLLNSVWDKDETIKHLPNSVKKYLADNDIKFYIINATKIAEEIGLGNRTNTIMQSAFFKIAEVIPFDKAVEEMKKAIVKTFSRKGEKIVDMNNAAVERGGDNVIEIAVLPEWSNLDAEDNSIEANVPDFIKNIAGPINAQKGDDLPVSAFLGYEDGTFPAGTTQYEKRGVAVNIPEWNADNCIQCNQCAYVCPHAAIRPFLINEEEMKGLPEGTDTITAKGKGFEGMQFRIQVSSMDCTGCGVCVEVCPSKEKSLVLKPLETQSDQAARWDYFSNNVTYKDKLVDKTKSVKNSQFAQPLFEFSGACAGCGETPYIKAVTQLYGERMMIANATGCSSIYGGSAPSTPYCANKESGRGPAWANSLFEDNAEYGYGMAMASANQRRRIARIMKDAIANGVSDDLKAVFEDWTGTMYSSENTEAKSAKVIAALQGVDEQFAKDILKIEHHLVKKSNWIIGGDGWAYDIGYGGLDHVLASGEDVNILVLDTEVYSNTGGQASKATPVGAVAKFAASGMKVRKKDLGAMVMNYGYVYVAQVAMGASQAQFFKALKEAEAYPGPSLIIAYSPCIAHGIKGGMSQTQVEQKNAVDSGYWHLYRHNPTLEAQGKNPFTLDSKEPDWSKFQNFLKGETRYTSLGKVFPDESERLAPIAEDDAKYRYKSYKRRANEDYSAE
ncbi:MAG: pyruvate:ferredoxin (flavodoxin) oxidoreductase, partial [Bacteroidota bacterium]|nr:pyruvate:ferredoxin (flavodoxin) oxidoreductase [Bacteroidota bacterium]